MATAPCDNVSPRRGNISFVQRLCSKKSQAKKDIEIYLIRHAGSQSLLSDSCWQPKKNRNVASSILISEKLKKAVAVSEEKIQERSRRRGRFSSSHFSLPENAQTLAGIAFQAAGKSVKNFPAASKFAGKLFQQGISDSHSLLEFSDYCDVLSSTNMKPSHVGRRWNCRRVSVFGCCSKQVLGGMT